MTAGLWGYDNHLLRAGAAVTAGSEVAGMTAANLSTQIGAEAWQTAGAVVSADGAWVQIDAGAVVDWRAFGLFRTNLTSAATLRWMLGTTAGASDVMNSGALPGTVVSGYGQSVHDAGQAYSARYLRVEIEDPANPDLYLRAGLMFAGPAFEPSRNFGADGLEEGWQDGNRVTETRGGQRYVTPGWERRRMSVAFGAAAEGEVYDHAEPMRRQARLGRNILLLPYPGYQEGSTAIFGEAEISPSTIPHGVRRYRGWSATITERL